MKIDRIDRTRRYSRPARNYAREDFIEKDATRLPEFEGEKTGPKYGYSQSLRELQYSGTLHHHPSAKNSS